MGNGFTLVCSDGDVPTDQHPLEFRCSHYFSLSIRTKPIRPLTKRSLQHVPLQHEPLSTYFSMRLEAEPNGVRLSPDNIGVRA